MKPEVKFENGILIVKAQLAGQVDADKDLKPSVKAGADIFLELDAYEAVTEIAKKDIAFLEAIIKKIKG